MSKHVADQLIPMEEAQTLGGLFRARVRRTPKLVAYRYYDASADAWRDLTWQEMAHYVARWQAALESEGFQRGDRVATMLRNGPDWAAFDQAALGLGLVTVALYPEDNPGNMAYMLSHSESKLLVVPDSAAWQRLASYDEQLSSIQRVVSVASDASSQGEPVMDLEQWLPAEASKLRAYDNDPNELATIIYTSGTTGRAKGVMLSHHNLLWNAWANAESSPAGPADVGLSFLPLAHVYERTTGYYVAMVQGVTVAYNRSVDKLLEDFQIIRPTILLSVPRVFERIYTRVTEGVEQKGGLSKKLFNAAVEVGYSRFERRQGRGSWRPSHLAWPLLNALVAKKIRALFGGRLRFTVSGGAPLAFEVARMFIGLGIDLRQGYGVTEASPTVSVNRPDDNDPAGVGSPLPDVNVKMAPNGELLVKSPGVMMGYWKDPDATSKTVDEAGWLYTGDKVSRIENGHIYITGRLKEIIVMANGSKASPPDVEQAIALDPVIEQVMVIGEGRPYLTALVVLSSEERDGYLHSLGLDPADPDVESSEVLEKDLLQRVAVRLQEFPHYAQVRRLAVVREPWTAENGLMTPTMKVKRRKVTDAYPETIEALYSGHGGVHETEIARNTRVAG